MKELGLRAHHFQLTGSRSRWLRFADISGSNGHIGKINDCLSGKNGDYQIWVDALFREKPELQSSITLKHPTYVKVETWTKESASIVPELEHTPLR